MIRILQIKNANYIIYTKFIILKFQSRNFDHDFKFMKPRTTSYKTAVDENFIYHMKTVRIIQISFHCILSLYFFFFNFNFPSQSVR